MSVDASLRKRKIAVKAHLVYVSKKTKFVLLMEKKPIEEHNMNHLVKKKMSVF